VHLLNRAGYGPRLGDVDRVRQQGFDRYVDEQLNPERIDDSATEALLKQFDTLDADAGVIWTRYQRNPRPILDQLQAQKVIRAIHSKRQLQEVMVEFWFNHFNVFWSKEDVQYLATGYERDAIRPFALGKFKDLLLATAKHPAMLTYLDNAVSGAPAINENYARELMELHTMGVDGGYSQKDVEEVARVFTGWTMDRNKPAHPFLFSAALHQPGEKTVLEHRIPAGGYDEGEAVLDILVHHPSTARFIATKLVRRLVADDPPAALVNKVAKVFSESEGDIRAMVRTILMSEEFSAPAAVRAKVKSPLEVVVSTIRAVDAEMVAVDSNQILANLRGLPADAVEVGKAGTRLRSPAAILVQTIQEMGQPMYQYAEPTGYPDRGDYWMSGWSVLHRLNFATALMEDRVLGVKVDKNRLASLLGEAGAGDSWKSALGVVTGAAEARPQRSVFASPEAVQSFVLALGSPEFQHK
jgi:uncharacterized protein (DUF1800 family)